MISIGVVGLGYWGPKLARNFAELSDAHLAWACDLEQSRLDQIKKLFPHMETTTSFRQVLDSDVDAVCIATPVRTHFHLVMQALQAGKHVLVEKPIAACSSEAEEIVAEADRQKRLIMVGHTFVYNPAIVAIKDIIERGVLGEIYYINATRVNLGLYQKDINVVWDLAPHDISILLYLLAMEPAQVSARGGIYVQRSRGLYDVAYLSLFFPNGIMADVRVSWLDPCKIRRYTFVGSEKMLVYDDIEPRDKILIYDKGVDVPPHSVTEEEFHLSYRTGDGVPYPLAWVEPLKIECQHFLDCIRDGTESRSSGRIGLQVVRVLEAAQCSLLDGGTMEVIGENSGFCALRTRHDSGPRCQELCHCKPVRV